MKRITDCCFGIGCLIAIAVSTGCSAIRAEQDVAETARNQIELTVYADDFAVVREMRPFELAQGRNKLRLIDVSKSLDQQSVMFQWPAKAGAQVVSSTYDLGVGDSGRLMQRFLGRKVELVMYSQDGTVGDTVEGILEVAEPGNVVIRADGKYLINPPGTIVAPSGGNIVTIPQLTAEVNSPSAQKSDLDLTYLTRGLRWSADYVATLALDADEMKLDCWATVTNQTGADFPSAKITLVAGSPNRAVRKSRERGGFEADHAARAKPEETDYKMPVNGNFDMPVAVGELHAYPVKAAATIAQDQMNRVRMIEARSVPIKRDYSTRLPDLSSWGDEAHSGWGTIQRPSRRSAQLAITFKNKEQGGLGLPLPQGAIRVYEPDKSASLRYIGAAGIQDTPKDAGVYLTLSDVFDVYTQGRIVKSRKVAKNTIQKEVELTLHNEKAKSIDLRLVQGFYGKWRIVSEDQKHKKLNSQQIQWVVSVPAGGQRTLKYVVEMKG